MWIIRKNTLPIIFVLALIFSGCGQADVHTKLVFDFQNLVGAGAGGRNSVGCLNGKLKAFSGSLIVPSGWDSGCKRSLNLDPPQGNQVCPNTPKEAASVKIDGILNNKPFHGTYSFGHCEKGFQAWTQVSDLWLDEGPHLVSQKVFIIPTGPMSHPPSRSYDSKFQMRSAAGESGSCLLLLSYRPLESQGCAMIAPEGSSAYIAYYMPSADIKELVGADPNRIIQILRKSKSGSPPRGFPGWTGN